MTSFGCVNNTIRTNGGTYFDLANPHKEQVYITDIAWALSSICRFGGHVDRFYTVAEHSVRCAEVASRDGHPRDVRLAVLLHDAAEAYVGDIVKPLKVMLTEFNQIEKKVESAISRRFGVCFESHRDIIKEIDHAMLIHERRSLFSPDKERWSGEDEVRHIENLPLECWNRERAFRMFINTFQKIIVNDYSPNSPVIPDSGR